MGLHVPRSGLARETGAPCFPVPAESGNGDSLPVSRPNRESGERDFLAYVVVEIRSVKFRSVSRVYQSKLSPQEDL